MAQVPPLHAHQLLRTSKFLTANNDDDRILDLIQATFTDYKRVNISFDSEPELNVFDDNECYEVIDKDNITYGTINRGGRELHMCGYSYQVKEENAITTRWRCVIRTPTRPVTIHTNNVDDSFHHWNGAYHHHPRNENQELSKIVMARIKATVLVEPYPVLTIVEKEIRNARMNKTQLAAMCLL